MSTDAIERIKKAAKRLPALHARKVEKSCQESDWTGYDKDAGSGEAWTVSDRPDRDGWCTDGGYEAYGLPRGVAEAIAELVNAAKEL